MSSDQNAKSLNGEYDGVYVGVYVGVYIGVYSCVYSCVYNCVYDETIFVNQCSGRMRFI